MSKNYITANLLALGAIALWSTLATLGVALTRVPPFLLTGLALLVGSLVALPLSGFKLSGWRVPLPTLALGIYGLFGFHFLLFVALRHAPPVQANLLNYLWPLLMVVLAPLFLPGLRLHTPHLVAALLGFAGAALVILGGADTANPVAGGWAWGQWARRFICGTRRSNSGMRARLAFSVTSHRCSPPRCWWR